MAFTRFPGMSPPAAPTSTRQVKPEIIQPHPFLSGFENLVQTHFMTQGDSNHFRFIGHRESTGELAIVTHQGSRALR